MVNGRVLSPNAALLCRHSRTATVLFRQEVVSFFRPLARLLREPSIGRSGGAPAQQRLIVTDGCFEHASACFSRVTTRSINRNAHSKMHYRLGCVKAQTFGTRVSGMRTSAKGIKKTELLIIDSKRLRPNQRVPAHSCDAGADSEMVPLQFMTSILDPCSSVMM
jgi:hypothetical protein